MSAEPEEIVAVIDAPAGRKLNNSLTLRFLEAPATEPFATALQGGDDGFGKKMGVLFGFKNGAPGRHVVTFTDGRQLVVPTVDSAPTAVVDGAGAPVLTITRGATTVATDPAGATVLSFLPDPVEPMANSHYRLVVTDAGVARAATMDVLRVGGGEYGVGELVETIDFALGGFVSEPGGSLALPFLGVRSYLHRELSGLERDVLVAACVELAIGVRPYVTAMGERGAAWT